MGKGSHEEDKAMPTVQDTSNDNENGGPDPATYGSKPFPITSNNKTSDQLTTEEEVKAALERQKERRERTPLLYCRLIAKYPLRCFLITLSGHLTLIIISAILVATGYNLLPIDFENLPLEINDQPWRPRDMAWRYRRQFSTYYDRTPVTSFRSLPYSRANMELYYDAKGGNVFTKANLQKIQEIEDRLVAVSGYSEYCQLGSSGSCQNPNSIIRYFDGSLSSVDATFNDPNFDNIPTVLYTALNNNATKSDFQFFLSKSYSITTTMAYSDKTRSLIPIGFPMEGYEKNVDGYEKKVRTFSATSLKPMLQDMRDNTHEFDVSYRSYLLWVEDVFNQAMKDVMCAIGSICFIFVCILFHTKSLWITGFAVLSIMTSFVGTNLIYTVILDFKYIGFFHILTLFIVLGIGADDIFVFYDVWRNTAYENYPSLAHRLSDAYRKSAFSMFFTSLTTCVAFFASAISPLLATRSFGIFSGIVIIVNYISVLLYFPTVVIMYHTKYDNFRWPCIQVIKRKCKNKCTCCNSTTETAVETIGSGKDESGTNTNRAEDDMVKSSKFGQAILEDEHAFHHPPFRHLDKQQTFSRPTTGMSNKAFVDDSKSDESSVDTITIEDARPKTASNVLKKRKEKSFMVRFFRTRYFAIVTHKVFRWIILLVTAAVLAVFMYKATSLTPDNEGLKVLKAGHVYRIAENHGLNSFVESDQDNTIIIYILWGLNQNDMSSCHFSTPKCTGSQNWDSNFNPSTTEAQVALQTLCSKMFSFSESRANELRIRKDYTTGQYQINCFIQNLRTFLDAETASTGTDWSLTYNYIKAVAFMNARTTYYDPSTFTSAYTHYLEIPISYWLSNKYTYNRQEDFYLFDHLIGEGEGTFTSTLKTDSAKKYGNDIKYIAIQVNTTMKFQTLGYEEGLPIMNLWEAFVNEEMKSMPAGLNNGFQLTEVIWHWLVVQEMLVKNAIYGIAIGVSLAFPLLTLATMNIITGSLATFSICCSTVCVIGVIPTGGWKLGVLVSLNMCMVVGLTVDYVVHLAEGYTLSLRKDRLSRVQDMLDEMAVPLFFGACTTLGASLFMFVAELSFFFQFGIFMFSTIGFSLFFSMGMFVTLMGIIGPQGDTGNIAVAARRLRDWCKSRRAKQ